VRRARWLLVAVCACPDGDFIVSAMRTQAPAGFGGDVLIHLRRGSTPELARVEVWAVARGAIVPVAAWDDLPTEGWPTLIGPAVAFAMSALGQLEEITDLGGTTSVFLLAGRTRWGSPAGLPQLVWASSRPETV
jgi:hypothetical protein